VRADEGAGGLVRGDEHPELREALPDLLGDVASDIGTLSGGLAGRLVASNAVWGQFDDGGAPDRRSGLRSSFTLGRTQASQASQLFMDKVAGLFARSTFGVSEVRLEACVRSETRFHEELDDLVNEGVPVLVIRVPILLLNEKFEHMKGDRIGELRELDRGLWRASAGFGEEHVERVSNPSHRERMDGGVERLPHMSEPAGHASDLLLQFVRRRDLRSRLAPFSCTTRGSRQASALLMSSIACGASRFIVDWSLITASCAAVRVLSRFRFGFKAFSSRGPRAVMG
jgi:hypothetical protein